MELFGVVCCVSQLANTTLSFYILTTLFYREQKDLYVILARRNELSEGDILNVEVCGSMLFTIIVFDIIVQSLVKL